MSFDEEKHYFYLCFVSFQPKKGCSSGAIGQRAVLISSSGVSYAEVVSSNLTWSILLFLFKIRKYFSFLQFWITSQDGRVV